MILGIGISGGKEEIWGKAAFIAKVYDQVGGPRALRSGPARRIQSEDEGDSFPSDSRAAAERTRARGGAGE